jgi:hypothetical protein
LGDAIRASPAHSLIGCKRHPSETEYDPLH